MASTATPQRSNASSRPSSPHSSTSTTSSSSTTYYDFTVELDKTLSSSLWIEFMEWSQNMDVIALIMHQANNDTQHLWLQRCVGKWQNLLSIDLSQELDDAQTRVVSIAWRYDGNGVCLGLSNGDMLQFLIESNDNNNNNKIIKSETHNAAIAHIQWVTNKNDHRETTNHDNEENDDATAPNDDKYDANYLNPSNYDNVDTLFRSDSNIDDIKSVLQNHETLLSCTQLNTNHYELNTAQETSNHLFTSLTFKDETNKFLSKIPSLPKPPRIDFRYKIDSKHNTLQHIMKKTSIPPIPRKSQPNALPLLITNDANEIHVHSSDALCIGKVSINAIQPSEKILKEISDENENKSNAQKEDTFHLQSVTLSHDFQCINSLMSRSNGDLWLRFIHCPILHCRRNELLMVTNHGDYIDALLNMLNKLERHLLSRWAMGVRSIKGKITPLQDNMERYNMGNTWQHEFKHNLLIGSPSTAFLQYVQQNLNVTALQRGYKQFDQFVNEMLDIVQKNLVHIIQELIVRCSELHKYSLWMERFGCLGIKEKKITAFVDKLCALYLKLDQLQILIADAKLNLTAFNDYLMFLSSLHNNEDSEFNKGFDKLDCQRILAAIDHDLQPSRVSLFLQNGLLPKKDLNLFSVGPKPSESADNPMLNQLLSKIKKKWKRFERYSFSYLLQDIRRSWKPILGVLCANISKSFVVENNDYGLLRVSNSNGSNRDTSGYTYHAVNHEQDIAFVTTDVFADLFGVEGDVNLCALTAKRTSVRDQVKQCKLMFLAIIPAMENINSKIILSDDIWTDDFDEFESIMSEFPAQASIKDIRFCVVDIEPWMEDETLHFDSMDIIQITFVNPYRLAVLAKLQSTKGRQKQTCLLTINLKKTELEFQGHRRWNDYEVSLNEMAFDFGMLPTQKNINDTNKYVFATDVDGYTLSVSGPRKLAAISCDPCIDGKCNRLIVLDINVEEEEEEEESDEDNGEDRKNDKCEMSENDESDSDDNEDSDLRKIIDVD